MLQVSQTVFDLCLAYARERCAARLAHDRFQWVEERAHHQASARIFANPDRSSWAALSAVKDALGAALWATDADFFLSGVVELLPSGEPDFIPQEGEAPFFEVSASWCKACGYGDAARRVPVVNVRRFPWAADGFRKMVDVRWGRHVWVVAEGRGRFVDTL